MTTLVEHARRELDLAGEFDSDPAMAQSIVAAVAAFSSYRHSGTSAELAADALNLLLHRRTLTPITNDPDEWIDRSEVSGNPLWQNLRDSAAFSNDGGRTYWILDEEDRRGAPRKENPARTLTPKRTNRHDTLFKVATGLRAAGIPEDKITDAVNQIMNQGILFRERA